MPTTKDNLLEAFIEESPANPKFFLFTKKADGNNGLFCEIYLKTTNYAKTKHSKRHPDCLDIFINEAYEYPQIYSPMLERTGIFN